MRAAEAGTAFFHSKCWMKMCVKPQLETSYASAFLWWESSYLPVLLLLLSVLKSKLALVLAI